MRTIVTGASRGIGAEFVRQLLDRGHEVHAVSRHPDRLSDLGKGANGKNLSIHEIDLENVAGPDRLCRALEGRKVDLLVNNAGLYVGADELSKLRMEDVRLSFEVNTLLPMRVCQALLGEFSPGAKVVQITSLMGSIGDNASGGAYAYRMSKAALNMFNSTFARERPDLTAIVLHPGWVRTEMGGKDAPTEPKDSVSGMLRVIERSTPKDSGKFYDFEGDGLPW